MDGHILAHADCNADIDAVIGRLSDEDLGGVGFRDETHEA